MLEPYAKYQSSSSPEFETSCIAVYPSPGDEIDQNFEFREIVGADRCTY